MTERSFCTTYFSSSCFLSTGRTSTSNNVSNKSSAPYNQSRVVFLYSPRVRSAGSHSEHCRTAATKNEKLRVRCGRAHSRWGILMVFYFLTALWKMCIMVPFKRWFWWKLVQLHLGERCTSAHSNHWTSKLLLLTALKQCVLRLTFDWRKLLVKMWLSSTVIMCEIKLTRVCWLQITWRY